MDQDRRGALYGAGAYFMWGLFPLYWPLLAPAGALESLSHRIVWSLVVVAALVVVTGRTSAVRQVLRDRRRTLRLMVAAAFIAANWGLYIYGVSSGQVVETALGYFINPLVTVLLGVVVLGERLRPVQWGALGLAAVAVLVLSVENGRPPLIALALAASFGTYGLLKKTTGVAPVEGLAVETASLAPVAAGFLLVQGWLGGSTLLHHGAGHIALLLGTGPITVLPLLLFGASAQRVPLTTLGLLQYVTPTMQFLIGVLLFHEPLGLAKLLGFTLVWIALAVFTVDVVAHHRREQRPAVLEPA